MILAIFDTTASYFRPCSKPHMLSHENGYKDAFTVYHRVVQLSFLPSFFICSINSVQYNMQLYNDEQDNKAKALTAALYKV